jgi:hypothetical protein
MTDTDSSNCPIRYGTAPNRTYGSRVKIGTVQPMRLGKRMLRMVERMDYEKQRSHDKVLNYLSAGHSIKRCRSKEFYSYRRRNRISQLSMHLYYPDTIHFIDRRESFSIQQCKMGSGTHEIPNVRIKRFEMNSILSSVRRRKIFISHN